MNDRCLYFITAKKGTQPLLMMRICLGPPIFMALRLNTFNKDIRIEFGERDNDWHYVSCCFSIQMWD